MTRRVMMRHAWQNDLEKVDAFTKTDSGKRIYAWRRQTTERSFAEVSFMVCALHAWNPQHVRAVLSHRCCPEHETHRQRVSFSAFPFSYSKGPVAERPQRQAHFESRSSQMKPLRKSCLTSDRSKEVGQTGCPVSRANQRPDMELSEAQAM